MTMRRRRKLANRRAMADWGRTWRLRKEWAAYFEERRLLVMRGRQWGKTTQTNAWLEAKARGVPFVVEPVLVRVEDL